MKSINGRTKILVTGASGFVGRAVIASIGSSNALCIGRTPVDGYEFISNDYNYSDSVVDRLSEVRVVIHCAGRAHVMRENIDESSSLYRLANIDTTNNIATMAAKAGVERFIYLSSIKVYGNSVGRPFCASDNAKPVDDYGLSKLCAERRLFEICRYSAMDYAIIRPPLIYGPNVKGNFESLSRFVFKGMPNPFCLLKNNKRSMVSIFNLVSLIMCCCEFNGRIAQILLVSDDEDISMAYLIKLLSASCHSRNIPIPIPISVYKLVGTILQKSEYVERLIGDLQVDITSTKKLLNWEPPYSVCDSFDKSFGTC